MRAEFWLSLKYLQRHKKTPAFFISILALIGIILGVAALILVISVMSGFDKEVKDRLLGFNYHATLYYEDITDNALTYVRGISGVKEAVRYAELQTAVRFDKQIAPVIVYAIEYSNREREHWRGFLRKGDLSGAVVGSILFKKLGLTIGDDIEVFNPAISKLDKMKVTGCFDAGLYDIDDMAVLIDPAATGERFAAEALKDIWALGVRLTDPDNASEFKHRLYSDNSHGLNFVSLWSDRNRTLFTWLKLEKIGAFIILSFIVVVAAFNIFATQSIRVVEKTKDIGILNTIGFSRGSIALMFCLQGIVVGVMGTFIGLALGLGLCYIVGYTDILPLPAELYHIKHIPVLVDWHEISVVCAVAFMMTFIFSLFPALKASSLNVVDAVGYE